MRDVVIQEEFPNDSCVDKHKLNCIIFLTQFLYPDYPLLINKGVLQYIWDKVDTVVSYRFILEEEPVCFVDVVVNVVVAQLE